MSVSLSCVQRVFVKRTRRGQIKTHVRQQYLRDDLPTGSPYLDEHHLEPRLQGDRYIVIDANVPLHQMDFLERSGIRDVIILQTVLEEVKHNKISIHKRLRTLVSDDSRRFHVFCNESHRETFVQRKPGESQNDRNDRAIRAAASWYQTQLGDSVEVLLLTNDRENLRLAEADGLRAQTVHAFVASLPNAAEVQDLLAPVHGAADADGADDLSADGARSKRKRKDGQHYPPHLNMSELTAGLQSGEFHQGKLRVSRYNPSRGSVGVRTLEGHSEVLVRGRLPMNRAIEGDTVVVKLLPREQWGSAEGKLAGRNASRAAKSGAQGGQGGGADGTGAAAADDDDDDEDDDDGGDGALQAGETGGHVVLAEFGESEAVHGERLSRGDGGGGGRPCGVVVGVVRRAWRPYVCVLDPESAIGQQYLTEPLDARIPRINISTRQAEHFRNKLLLISVDFWEPQHRYPTGHYVRTLGDVGDRGAESEAILHEHEVNTAPFSPQVQACLPEKGWQIPEEEIAKRLDLRNGGALVCSVDPPGCVDIDDALHAKLLPNGNFEVGVHIADVGHFIKAGSAIDAEAAERGTTVYLVDRRIDMVPKRLGEDLCSLHQKVDRLAFSVIWELDADAKVVSTKFVKSVICSEAALSYAEAQARLDDARLDDELTRSLRILNSLAKKLKAARNAAGALTLRSPEVRFKIDESAEITEVGMYELKEANSMVEEFMLLANISVAAEITRAFPLCAMLRRHPPPLPGAFDTLQRSLSHHGFSLDTSSSLALSASLDACVKPEDPYFNELTRILTTRSMQQARYFCSGTLSPSEYLHYGLASPIYTHFTSPIRRYADQVVHRLLAAIIHWEPVSSATLDAAAMTDLTDNLNLRHTMGQYAGRASIGLHTLIYFRNRQVEEDAYVIKVRDNGVVVLVPRYGVESIVYVCDSGEANPFTFDEKNETLRAPGCVLRTFDKVRVAISVDSTKPHRPKLELAIVRPLLPGRRVA